MRYQNIISNNFIEMFFTHVWFYLEFLGYPSSGSWLSRQCQVWGPSYFMVVYLDQPLFGHFHKFCSTITPVHLTGRRDCSSKVLWFDWCPSYTNLLWLQKMTGSDYSSLLGVSSRITLVHSRFHYNSENTTLLL